jgi:hypothetical protein
VELYSAIGWLAVCAALLWLLARTRRVGVTAAWGLVLGGLLVFVSDFFHLPAVLYSNGWLDRIQWQALCLAGGGCLMLVFLPDVAARGDGPARGMEGASDAL